MVLTAYPFESANTTEDQYTLLFRNFASTGIAGNYGDGQLLVTTDGSGLDVQIAAGYAIIRGHAVSNDGPVTATVGSSGSAYSRLDRIVLRLDPALDGIFPHVIQGNPSANPVLPPLVQTSVGIYDFPLATVVVGPSALNVVATDITSTRVWGAHRSGVWTTSGRPVGPGIGQLGYNVTLKVIEVWSGTQWESTNPKKKITIPHTFTISGPIAISSGNDYFIPPFFVPAPAGQTVRLTGGRHDLRSGGTVLFNIQLGSTVVTSGVVTTAPGTMTLDNSIPNGQLVYFVVTGITETPQNLTCTLYLEYEV